MENLSCFNHTGQEQCLQISVKLDLPTIITIAKRAKTIGTVQDSSDFMLESKFMIATEAWFEEVPTIASFVEEVATTFVDIEASIIEEEPSTKA